MHSWSIDQANQHTLAMDIPFEAWLPELDMEDPREFMYEHQQTPSYSELVDSFCSPNFKDYHQNLVTRDHSTVVSGNLDKQEISYKVTSSTDFGSNGGSTSNTFTISFGDYTSPTTALNQNQVYKLECDDDGKEGMNLNELLGSIQLPKRVSSTRRNHRQAQEHILAERKRREKLTQRFISLSNLLPEIKKMDKATVLEDASKYIKQLQNRVKELEETSISGKTIIQESTDPPSSRKSKFHGGNNELDASSFDETNPLHCNAAYNSGSGIKVRILGCNVLVRIYSQRNSPLALKALTEMERLHLTIMCNSVLPISTTATLITIIAQMSEEFVMTANDLVKCLQSSLLKYRSITCT